MSCARSQLQEYYQKHKFPAPVYVARISGPDHAPFFSTNLFQGDDLVSSGDGKTKRDAAEAAAQVACQKLGISDVLVTVDWYESSVRCVSMKIMTEKELNTMLIVVLEDSVEQERDRRKIEAFKILFPCGEFNSNFKSAFGENE